MTAVEKELQAELWEASENKAFYWKQLVKSLNEKKDCKIKMWIGCLEESTRTLNLIKSEKLFFSPESWKAGVNYFLLKNPKSRRNPGGKVIKDEKWEPEGIL